MHFAVYLKWKITKYIKNEVAWTTFKSIIHVLFKYEKN